MIDHGACSFRPISGPPAGTWASPSSPPTWAAGRTRPHRTALRVARSLFSSSPPAILAAAPTGAAAMSRTSRCGRWPNCRISWTNGSLALAEQAPRRAPRPRHPGRAFTPNEKYAALVETAGYVPVALGPDDYVELLPAEWRAVNAYGIKLNRRTYDCDELARCGCSRPASGNARTSGRSATTPMTSPESTSAARRLDHRVLEVPEPGPVPFGELAWDHARRGLGRGATEEEIAHAVAALLRRAGQGPEEDGKARPEQAGPPGRRPHQGRRPERSRPGPSPATRAAGTSRAGRSRRTAGQGDPDADLRPVRGSRQAMVSRQPPAPMAIPARGADHPGGLAPVRQRDARSPRTCSTPRLAGAGRRQAGRLRR